MASYAFDLKPCSRLTVDALGPAGQRTFYLQGVKGLQVVTLIIEIAVEALAAGIDELLDEVEAQHPLVRGPELAASNLSLLDPLSPLLHRSAGSGLRSRRGTWWRSSSRRC